MSMKIKQQLNNGILPARVFSLDTISKKDGRFSGESFQHWSMIAYLNYNCCYGEFDVVLFWCN